MPVNKWYYVTVFFPHWTLCRNQRAFEMCIWWRCLLNLFGINHWGFYFSIKCYSKKYAISLLIFYFPEKRAVTLLCSALWANIFQNCFWLVLYNIPKWWWVLKKARLNCPRLTALKINKMYLLQRVSLWFSMYVEVGSLIVFAFDFCANDVSFDHTVLEAHLKGLDYDCTKSSRNRPKKPERDSFKRIA